MTGNGGKSSSVSGFGAGAFVLSGVVLGVVLSGGAAEAATRAPLPPPAPGLAVHGLAVHEPIGGDSATAGVVVLSRIAGIVETREGHPLPGALVSVMAVPAADAGEEDATHFAVTDAEGRFDVGAEPGLYSLRAYLAGFLPSPRAQVLVESGGSFADTLLIQLAALRADSETGNLSELRWLLQRGSRNVLRDRRAGLEPFDAFQEGWWGDAARRVGNSLLPVLASVEGEFGFLAASGTPLGLSESRGADSGIAYTRFTLPSTARGHWEAEVRLMESAFASWATQLSYRMDEFDGHEFAAGIGYQRHVYEAAGDYRPHQAPILNTALLHEPQAEWDGAAFIADDVTLGRVSVRSGLTYRRFSYLRGHQGLAPRAVLEVKATDRLTFVSGAAARVDGPIGEDAALLSRVVHGDLLAADPSWFRSMAAQRSMRLQTGAHYELSEHASIAGRVFREDTTDQLIREFASGPIGGGHFDVANAGAWRAYGVGVQLARDMAPITRRLDLALRAAWSAAFVEGRIAEQPDAVATQADASLRAAVPGVAVTALVPGVPVLVQDLSVEGVARIRPSGTRIQGAVRWIFHPDLAPGLASAAVAAAPHTTRFDVEFIQRMPFSTRGAEWEFSVAIRDLFFRDMAERAFLDELAVARAPKRIIGGLAVRF